MAKKLVIIGEVHTSPSIRKIGSEIRQRVTAENSFSVLAEITMLSPKDRAEFLRKLDTLKVRCSPHLELFYRLFGENKPAVLEALRCTDETSYRQIVSRGLEPYGNLILPIEPFYSVIMSSIIFQVSPQRLLLIHRQIDEVLSLFTGDETPTKELSLLAHYKKLIIQVLQLQAIFGKEIPSHCLESERELRLRSELQAEHLGKSLRSDAVDIFALVGAAHVGELISSLKGSYDYAAIDSRELVTFDPARLTLADVNNNPNLLKAARSRLRQVIDEAARHDGSIKISFIEPDQ